MTPTFDSHANLTLTSIITAPSPATSGTSVGVATGTSVNFPTPPFNVTMFAGGVNPTKSNSEIARVTAVDTATDTLTIIRAQEGTTAQAVAVGWLIGDSVTVKSFTDIENTILNGLVPDNNAATYVSATSFTLPYNATSIYTAGRLIQFDTAGTLSTGVVISSSYTSPTTTVTTDGGVPTTITSLSYQIAPLGSTQIEGQYQIQNSTITGSQIVSNPTFQGTASDSRNTLIAALGSWGGGQQNNLGTGSVVESDNGTTGYYNIPEGNVFAIGVSGDANAYTGVVTGPPGGGFTSSTFYLPSQTGTVRITYIYMT